MVFVKTSSICNTGRTVDLRVQCTLSIQRHKLQLQALIDSGASSSSIDEETITYVLSQHLIKFTNQP